MKVTLDSVLCLLLRQQAEGASHPVQVERSDWLIAALPCCHSRVGNASATSEDREIESGR